MISILTQLKRAMNQKVTKHSSKPSVFQKDYKVKEDVEPLKVDVRGFIYDSAGNVIDPQFEYPMPIL
jgi:predicted dithiol-disulfide oxidoreductase (DUF899 family)